MAPSFVESFLKEAKSDPPKMVIFLFAMFGALKVTIFSH